MGHRKWSFGSAPAAEVSLKELEREHGELYDELRASERRVTETLDENNRLDRDLDEARQRISELESPIRVPFSDAQINDMVLTFWACYNTRNKTSHDAIRAALAAGGLEPCAVPEYTPDDVALAPSDDEVEALARALHTDDNNLPFEEIRSYRMEQARAAIAHLAKRPEGLPTAEELAKQSHEVMLQKYPTDYYIPYEDCDSKVIVSRERFSDAILTALRHWLRDPVGWELDVTADVIEVIARSSSRQTRAQEILDLCRSRISPVYECKECAKKDTRIDMYDRQQNMMAKSIEAQRQGLERAAAAARAALEGE